MLGLRSIALAALFATGFQCPVMADTAVNNMPVTEDATVGKVLDAIEKRDNIYFTYSSDLVDTERTVQIDITGKTIPQVLRELFPNENIGFKTEGNHVVIFRQSSRASVDQQARKTVTGIVQDANGPLIGVNILEEGTTNGTITDIDGRFTIEVASDATLEITYVGYMPQKIGVAGRNEFNITLKEDSQTLDELVVIGYGSVKKSDLTGSVSSVKAEDMAKMATNSPIAALQGRAAGVSVSLGSGSPDATPSIRIRGVGTPNDSSPLYVVDGFPMSDIDYLNPNDIESIEILKDASACAIYGSRGANGVVVVTTKKGKAGAMKVNLTAYYGIERLASTPEMLNAQEYQELSNVAYENAGLAPLYSNPSNTPYNTNWYDEITKLGQFQNYNINLSGGNEKVQSIFSANYYRKDGIIKSTDYERISLNSNNIFNVADFLKFNTSLTLSMSDYARLNPTSVFVSSLIAPPDIPVIDPETEYYAGITKLRLENPAGKIDRNNGQYGKLFFIGNFSADLKLMKELIFTSRFGIKVVNSHDKNFQGVYYETADISSLVSTVSRSTVKTTDWTWENMLTYNHTFSDKHALTVMAAMSARNFTQDSYSATKQGTPSDSKEYWYFDAATINPLVNGDGAELSMLSYLGRINYNFLDRYLITGSIRADGSSRFMKHNRWGYFPSGALAWKFSEENFFKNWNQKWFNSAKIRIGYGAIGNENISSYYPYLTSISQGDYYTLGQNQDRVNGAIISSLGNPDAQWETSTQLNFGVDLGFFNNRLNITADYYIRKTDNILLSQQIPQISGFSSMVRNVGGMENKGFELTIGFKGSKGDFSYNLNGNLALVKNKVTDLGTSEALVASFPYDNDILDVRNDLGNIIRSVVGKPYGSFYGYVTDGIFQNQAEVEAYQKDGKLIQPDAQPGDMRFKDLNGNGQLDDGDMDFIGNPIPDITYGLSFDATYKNFDLSLLLQGVAGNDVYNASKYYFMRFDARQNVSSDYLKEYWRGENTSNKQPLPTADITRSKRNFRNSNYYIESGSYLRLKTIQIGYTFTPRISTFQPSIRLYIAAQNLFTITSYSGTDPEIATDLSIDRGQYPQAQSFMLGTIINF